MGDPGVRPIEDGDVAGAAAALVEVYGTDGYPVEGVAQPEAWIRPSGVVAAWVAETDGRIVGHVAVLRPQEEGAVVLWRERSGGLPGQVGLLARLFVVQTARRRAVGELLVRHAMSFAEARSLRLVLDVMAKDTAAVRLYERLGWYHIGEVPHPYAGGRRATAHCYVWPPGP
jgi:ribosomal protein S18 acetylase RimI-like enzyme